MFCRGIDSNGFFSINMFQDGIIRVKLAKILDGYDDIHYERSAATEKSIKTVCVGAGNLLLNNFYFTIVLL